MPQPLYEIRDVWSHNLEAEMEVIRNLIEKYPYVAMVRMIFIHTLLKLYFNKFGPKKMIINFMF